MSTTFEVYPSRNTVPSFRDVLKLSNQYLSEWTVRNGLTRHYKIDVRLNKLQSHKPLALSIDAPTRWAGDCYAWFVVEGVAGGSDAYFYTTDDLVLLGWEEEFAINPTAKVLEQEMRNCLNTGHYWSFRRSAGQPAIVNLIYGLVAAAFATLTDGYIWSDDGGWDYKMFPLKADRFVQHYFSPNYPDKECADWTRQCLDILRQEDGPIHSTQEALR